MFNRGNTSTFNRGTIIDLTIATPRTAQRTTKREVFNEESLSDHFYLSFIIDPGDLTLETTRAPKIDLQRLTTTLDSGKHHPILECMDAKL